MSKTINYKLILGLLAVALFAIGFIFLAFPQNTLAVKNYNSAKSNTSSIAIIDQEIGDILLRYGVDANQVVGVTNVLLDGIDTDDFENILIRIGIGDVGVDEVLAKLVELGAVSDDEVTTLPADFGFSTPVKFTVGVPPGVDFDAVVGYKFEVKNEKGKLLKLYNVGGEPLSNPVYHPYNTIDVLVADLAGEKVEIYGRASILYKSTSELAKRSAKPAETATLTTGESVQFVTGPSAQKIQEIKIGSALAPTEVLIPYNLWAVTVGDDGYESQYFDGETRVWTVGDLPLKIWDFVKEAERPSYQLWSIDESGQTWYFDSWINKWKQTDSPLVLQPYVKEAAEEESKGVLSVIGQALSNVGNFLVDKVFKPIIGIFQGDPCKRAAKNVDKIWQELQQTNDPGVLDDLRSQLENILKNQPQCDCNTQISYLMTLIDTIIADGTAGAGGSSASSAQGAISKEILANITKLDRGVNSLTSCLAEGVGRDLCENIKGDQTEVPKGVKIDGEGNCDLCTNIRGLQIDLNLVQQTYIWDEKTFTCKELSLPSAELDCELVNSNILDIQSCIVSGYDNGTFVLGALQSAIADLIAQGIIKDSSVIYNRLDLLCDGRTDIKDGNLELDDICSPQLPPDITDYICNSGLTLDQINAEIAQCITSTTPSACTINQAQCVDLGCVWVDDFGGYTGCTEALGGIGPCTISEVKCGESFGCSWVDTDPTTITGGICVASTNEPPPSPLQFSCDLLEIEDFDVQNCVNNLAAANNAFQTQGAPPGFDFPEDFCAPENLPSDNVVDWLISDDGLCPGISHELAEQICADPEENNDLQPVIDAINECLAPALTCECETLGLVTQAFCDGFNDNDVICNNTTISGGGASQQACQWECQ